MKVVLIGANGQLGHQLNQSLQTLGVVRALTRADLDLASPLEVMVRLHRLAQEFVPDVVVNAAAYTAVDKAESEPALALAVNAQSVSEISKFAAQQNAVLVHYSTDYVFDGLGHTPWQEDDAPHPLSVYGQSKWQGEQAVAQHGGKFLIFRTSWVVGAHGGNFLKTMLRLAAERYTLRVVADQVGAPTSTELLTQATCVALTALKNAEPDDARWGTYHLAAAGETHWCDYARYVVAGALQRGAVLKTKPEQIQAITTSEYPLLAPRPMNSRLNTTKFQSTFQMHLGDWREGVDRILDQLIQRPST
jgi:dTDP-4-dehydrorhamnose reductase